MRPCLFNRPRTLFKVSDAGFLAPADVTADGRQLLYTEMKASDSTQAFGSRTSVAQLKVVAFDNHAQPVTVLEHVDPATNARLKPRTNDWVAYQASESGRSEIYLTRFPHPAAKYQIPQGGGTQPVWSRDGKTLYYLDTSQKLTEKRRKAPPFRAGDIRRICEAKPISARIRLMPEV